MSFASREPTGLTSNRQSWCQNFVAAEFAVKSAPIVNFPHGICSIGRTNQKPRSSNSISHHCKVGRIQLPFTIESPHRRCKSELFEIAPASYGFCSFLERTEMLFSVHVVAEADDSSTYHDYSSCDQQPSQKQLAFGRGLRSLRLRNGGSTFRTGRSIFCSLSSTGRTVFHILVAR